MLRCYSCDRALWACDARRLAKDLFWGVGIGLPIGAVVGAVLALTINLWRLV